MSAERGFVLQPTYRVRGGRPVVQLWGRQAGNLAIIGQTANKPR